MLKKINNKHHVFIRIIFDCIYSTLMKVVISFFGIDLLFNLNSLETLIGLSIKNSPEFILSLFYSSSFQSFFYLDFIKFITSPIYKYDSLKQ